MSYRIIDVPVPEHVTSEPTWQVEATAALSNALDREVWGHDDYALTPAQVVAGLAHQENAIKKRYLALEGDSAEPGPDDVVGMGLLWMPRHDNVTTGNLFLGTRADARGRGVATALWDHVRQQAAEHGRSVLQAWTGFAREPDADDPHALTAPTGSGRVPSTDSATRFALARGFSLEQAERHSLLELPADADAVERFRAEAAARAGADYEIVAWDSTVPDEWMEQYCVLQTRMSTDAPSAGMSIEEETWTPERVRDMERAVADNGFSGLVVAALHRPSGELAGYTELQTEEGKPEVAGQENTIVRSEHRGHRLGMLLKAVNLQRLAAERPDVRRVHTWNAEENSYMLSINVALGFRPAGGGAAWQLTLPTTA
jgi:GNAT superfamily N-acetyltransferase